MAEATEICRAARDQSAGPGSLREVVAEAAIGPAPDPVRLAVPKACVALVAGFEPTEETALDLLRYARERLAPYQGARRLEFSGLPKTISGKIRRVELRGREAADRDQPAPGESRDDTLRGQA